MHVVIFTSPSFRIGSFVSEAIETADKFIAADCGAVSALSAGIVPDVVVGDLDSLDMSVTGQLLAKKVKVVRSPVEKDETDTQLAVSYARAQGATEITIVGGLDGERFEHAFANVCLTYNPKIPIFIVNGPSKTWVVSGPKEVGVQGEKGDLLSLIALSQEVTGITTAGLYYPLRDEPLYFGVPRGMSNVLLNDTALVSIKGGILLLAHTKSSECQARRA